MSGPHSYDKSSVYFNNSNDYEIQYGKDLADFSYVSTKQIAAYKDSYGSNYDITVAASSNVNIEATNNVNMYVNSNDSVVFYNYEMDTVSGVTVRNDTEILRIQHNIDTTFVSSANTILSLKGMDSNNTTILSDTTFFNTGDYQIFNTLQTQGFQVQNPMFIASNLTVGDSILCMSNLAVSGNTYTETMNIFSTNVGGSQIAYSMYINEFDQLEMLKYIKYTNAQNISSSSIARVATFAKGVDSSKTSDPASYTIMNQFNGMYGTAGGHIPGQNSIQWTTITANSSDIFYVDGNVGIGTKYPVSELNVVGDLTIAGNILPASNNMYSIGSPTNAFKSLYVAANTIYIGSDVTLGLDNNSNPVFKKADGAIITSIPNIYSLNGNTGVGNDNPQYELDIGGAVNAMGYCNLIVQDIDANSTDQYHVPSVAGLYTYLQSNVSALVADFVYDSNLAMWASNAATYGSNTAFDSSNLLYATTIPQATAASNMAVSTSNLLYGNTTSYATATSNMAVGTSNVLFQTTIPQATATSNLAMWSSNAATYGSNTSYTSSNLLYGTTIPQATATSNLAVWSSNAATYGSNTSYTSSNLLYGTTIPQATATSNMAVATSNLLYSTTVPQATATSNMALWASNNLLNRNTGGTITGPLNVTGDLVVSGTTSYINTQALQVDSNQIVLNYGDTQGPYQLQSGIVICRGTSTNFQMLYDETSQTFQTGFVGTLQKVPTISNNVAANGYTYYNYATNSLTLDNSIATNATTTSNLAVWSSNAATYGSNTAYASSNLLYGTTIPQATATSNMAVSSSNLLYGNTTSYATATSNMAMWSSNAATYGSNTAYASSNLLYGNTTSYATATSNLSVATSNLLYGTTIPQATATSNLAVANSNLLYGNTTSYANATSNLAMWSSNAATYGSNTSYTSSNLLYGTTIPQATATSNLSVATSNLLYGTTIPQATATSNLAVTSSNTLYPQATFGSNTAVWSSNNMFNKAGGAIYGPVTMSNGLSLKQYPGLSNQILSITNTSSNTLSLAVADTSALNTFAAVGDSLIQSSCNLVMSTSASYNVPNVLTSSNTPANYKALFFANQLALTNGAAVTSWGGFTQGTTAKQPLYNITGGGIPGTYPYVTFGSSNTLNYLNKSSLALNIGTNNGFTAIFCIRINGQTTTSTFPRLFSAGSGGYYIEAIQNGSMLNFTANNVASFFTSTATNTVVFGTWQIFTFRLNGTAASIYSGNTSVATTTSTTSLTNYTYPTANLGVSFGNSGDYLAADIAYAAVYDSFITDATLASLVSQITTGKTPVLAYNNLTITNSNIFTYSNFGIGNSNPAALLDVTGTTIHRSLVTLSNITGFVGFSNSGSSIAVNGGLIASSDISSTTNMLAPNITATSNLAVWSSNAATYGSNTTYASSNLLYGTTIPQATATSNLAVTNSNTLYPLAFGALAKSSNLADVTNVALAQNNIGLGTACNVAFSNITVSGNILPANNLLQELGSSNNRFNRLWVNDLHLGSNTLYIGDTPFLGTSANTINFTSDSNQSISIITSGTGITQLNSANQVTTLAPYTTITSTNGGTTITSTSANQITASNGANAITSLNGAVTVTASNGGIQLTSAGANQNIGLTANGVNANIGIVAQNGVNISGGGILNITGGGALNIVSSTANITAATTTIQGSASVSQNLTVSGNLTVNGTTTYVETQTLKVDSNQILLNASDVTNGGAYPVQSGFVISRGYNNPSYKVVYDETSQTFQVGMSGTLQAVPTISNNAQINGYTYYNYATNSMTLDTMVGANAIFGSNAGAFGSNLAVTNSNTLYPKSIFASNLAVTSSNALYPQATFASNLAVTSSNTLYPQATFGSNLAVTSSNALYPQATFASNLAVTSSNTLYPQATFGSNLAVTSSNTLYPQATFGSNTGVWASNLAVTSSNALYPQATFGSNTGVWASNLAVTSSNTLYPQATFASNLAVTSSNTLYPQAAFGSNTGVWASNLAVANSNTLYPKSIYASNLAITNSNTLYPQATFASNLAVTSSNTLYPQATFGSNAGAFGSNLAVTISNAIYPQALTGYNTGIFASNLAVTSSNTLYPQATFGSNTGVWASNLAVASSNTLYPQAAFASNLAVTSSNTLYPQAAFASNLAVASSNTLYPQATFGSNASAWASNLAVTSSNTLYPQATFGSNASAWASNNMITKAGGTITGNLNVTGDIVVSGTTSYVNTQSLQVDSNQIVLNFGDTQGPYQLQSGIVICRGTSTNYQMLFDETSGTFQTGFAGTLQKVPTISNNVAANGYAYYNYATNSLTLDNTVATNATATSNLAVWSSNAATYGSNLAVANSNALYPQAAWTSNNMFNAKTGGIVYGPITLSNASGTVTLSNNGSSFAFPAASIPTSALSGVLSQWSNIAGGIGINSNVAIGSLVAATPLDVTGASTLRGAVTLSNSTGSVTFSNNGNTFAFPAASIPSTAISGTLSQWSTGTGANIGITQSNVGIGTTAPQSALDIRGVVTLSNATGLVSLSNSGTNLDITGSVVATGTLSAVSFSNAAGSAIISSSGAITSGPISSASLNTSAGAISGGLITANAGLNVYNGITVYPGIGSSTGASSITSIVGFSNASTGVVISTGTGSNIQMQVGGITSGTFGSTGLTLQNGTSSIFSTSDRRIKNNIVDADIDQCYANIKNLPLRNFTWAQCVSESNVPGFGWIAQEVEDIMPYAVKQEENYGIEDFKYIDSDKIIKNLYGAVQKLMAIVEQLSNK